jgi:tripartite-type tricarboxylate transporter receptor subunit TctC
MRLHHLLLAIGLAAQMGPALAQTYPTKPIRLIVPFAAGGPADVVARELGQKLGGELGQTVIVENQGGGAGISALTTVTRSEPDGHTLLFAASGNIVLQPQVSKAGVANLVAKLRPVAMVSTGPHVLVVSSKLPVKTVKEFIDHVRAHPGALSYGSAGVGGVAHLGMEYLQALAKTEMTHVPYKGTAAAINDLTAGNVQAMFSSPPSLQAAIDKGYVRALGMSAPGGTGAVKSLPLIGSTVPGFEFTTWYALYTPLETPTAIVEKVGNAVRKTVTDPALKAKMEAQGVELTYAPGQDLMQIMKRDTDKWAKVIRDAKLTIE